MDFTAAMADAASTIVKYFRSKKGILFINVLANISILCDCGVKAPEPEVRDIGILASTDPVAIDKACYDLIVKENTNGSNAWKDWADERFALNTIKVAEKLGIGTSDYNLIDVDADEQDQENEEDQENLWYVWYLIIPIGGVLLLVLIIFMVIRMKKRKEKVKLIDEETGLGSAVVSRVG